jgi:hypothetical protein
MPYRRRSARPQQDRTACRQPWRFDHRIAAASGASGQSRGSNDLRRTYGLTNRNDFLDRPKRPAVDRGIDLCANRVIATFAPRGCRMGTRFSRRELRTGKGRCGDTPQIHPGGRVSPESGSATLFALARGASHAIAGDFAATWAGGPGPARGLTVVTLSRCHDVACRRACTSGRVSPRGVTPAVRVTTLVSPVPELPRPPRPRRAASGEAAPTSSDYLTNSISR